MTGTPATEAVAYEHPGVVARVSREHGVPAHEAQRWFREMLKFLHVCAALRTAPTPSFRPVPPPLVDAAWHAFILHTRDYAAYCDAHLGGFVHHDPAPPSELEDGPDEVDHGEILSALKTRAVVQQLFGAIEEDLWPLPRLEPAV